MSNKFRAFSFIELSITIVVVGLLISAIAQGGRAIIEARKSSAAKLTLTSPAAEIDNMVLWLETTSDKSFDAAEAKNNKSVSTWHDINPTAGTIKSDATQISESEQPTYTSDVFTSLPLLKFDGVNDYMDLPDKTIPYGNSSYTVFFVSKTNTLTRGTVLCTYSSTENTSNCFRYTIDSYIINYWWANDLSSYSGSVSTNKLQIFSFVYDNTVGRKVYIDGISKSDLLATTNRNSATTPNYISNPAGLNSNVTTLDGYIGEIIVYDRALTTQERQDIEKYLGKKWGIKI